MADTINLDSPSVVTVERLEKVQDLLRNLKDDARAAHQANDTYMAGVYQQLLDVCSPIVVAAHARLERETRATFRKAHRSLKKADRAAKNGNAS